MNEINELFNAIISEISLLEIVVKGAIIGIVASAPMGPVGVLCVQRTLNKGRVYGIVTGTGAALSDILYALLTGYGLSFLYEFISNPSTLFWMQIIGAVVMFIFGIHTFRTNPMQNTRNVSRNKSNLLHNGITGFFITLSNPLILLLFMALFTPFNFMLPDMPLFNQCVGYLSIFGGAMLWWLFI
ncbi:MAG: LysE family transporter, partial [Bacteroidaceae bacterium]|nr:LysE family transporter [Bacteroidaceae bacterium]